MSIRPFSKAPSVHTDLNAQLKRQRLIELCGLTHAVDRLDRIEVLSRKIQRIRDKMNSKGKIFQACLYKGPPNLRVPIPWEGNREVSVREATHLFLERRKQCEALVHSGKMSEPEFSEVIEKPIYEFYQSVSPKIQEYNKPIYLKLRFRSLRGKMAPLVQERKKHVIEFLDEDCVRVKNSPEMIRTELKQKMRSTIEPRLPHLKQSAKKIKAFLHHCAERTKARLESGEKSKADVMVEKIEQIQRVFDQYNLLLKKMASLNKNSQAAADLVQVLDAAFFPTQKARDELRDMETVPMKNGRVKKAIYVANIAAKSFPQLPYTLAELENNLYAFRRILDEMSYSFACMSKGWDSLFEKEYVTMGEFVEAENQFKKFKADFAALSDPYHDYDRQLKGFSCIDQFSSLLDFFNERIGNLYRVTNSTLRKYEERFVKYRQKHYAF